jgi:hypothetical protein
LRCSGCGATCTDNRGNVVSFDGHIEPVAKTPWKGSRSKTES